MSDAVFVTKATLQLDTAGSAFHVTCAHCVGHRLFVGTSHGHLVSYNYDGRVGGEFTAGPSLNVTQDFSSPVRSIHSASALDRLLVEANGHLFALSLNAMQTLGAARFKAVTCVAVNENPCENNDDPFSMQLAVGLKSRKVLLCLLTTENIRVLFTVAVEGPPLALSYDSSLLCFATRHHYYVYDRSAGQLTPLFPIDADDTQPLVQAVGESEFLVCGMQGLGVFTDRSGVSSRPPLLWAGDDAVSLAFRAPYVLALGRQYLTVHDMNDQKIKQRLSAPLGGDTAHGRVNYCDGVVCVAGADSITLLAPVSWLQRVESLLADDHVAEAVSVARANDIANERDPAAFQTYERLMRSAGFKSLQAADFTTALDVLQHANLDVREVAALYDGMLPAATDFVPAQPPLHSIPNINRVMKDGDATDADVFLRDLLTWSRANGGDAWTKRQLMDADSCLVKLHYKLGGTIAECFEFDQPQLLCDIGDCAAWMNGRGAFWCLAQLYRHYAMFADALALCERLNAGELDDAEYPGVETSLEIIQSCKDVKMWSRHLPPALSKLADVGNSVKYAKWCEVMARSAIDAMSAYETAVAAVRSHPDTLRALLIVLVLQMKIEAPALHDELAAILSRCVVACRTAGSAGCDAVAHLRQLIATSQCIDNERLMDTLKHEALAAERAFFAGKMGDDSSAISALVCDLRDVDGALQYCALCGRSDEAYACLVQTALDAHRRALIADSDALHVLRSAASSVPFDWLVAKVPDSWPVSGLAQSAQLAISEAGHRRRLTQLAEALAAVKCSQSGRRSMDLSNGHFEIDSQSSCCVCREPLAGVQFCRYPTGALVHRLCMRYDQLCPLTNTVLE